MKTRTLGVSLQVSARLRLHGPMTLTADDLEEIDAAAR